jgi:hypothetical protein
LLNKLRCHNIKRLPDGNLRLFEGKVSDAKERMKLLQFLGGDLNLGGR